MQNKYNMDATHCFLSVQAPGAQYTHAQRTQVYLEDLMRLVYTIIALAYYACAEQQLADAPRKAK